MSFLAQKLRRGGVARSPLPDTDLIGETFARFIEESLRPHTKTSVSAMLLESRVVKLSEAVEGISVPSLLGLIEVEDADTNGLMCIDTDLAYHLLDLALGGDPEQAPVPTTRTFTAIDMALGRLHQEALLGALTKALGAIMNRPVAKAIQIGQQHQNVSQIRFAPGYIDILLYNVALDIGEAARTGNCMLLLPLATLDVIRASVRTSGPEERNRPDDLWRIAMRSAAATAPVEVTAVLHRRPFTVAELQKFELGDVIQLPEQSVGSIELVIGQPNGRTATIACGRVGAYRGAKVVKLSEDVDPRLRLHVKSAI
jgi:flagellar motor switch protein FliM